MNSNIAARHRAFLAIGINQAWKRYISSLPRLLDSRKEFEWLGLQNLYLTLTSLGEINEEQREALEDQLPLMLSQYDPFEIKISGLLLLPNRYDPNVLALKLKPKLMLAELAGKLKKAALEAGIPQDDREFLPQLTIAGIQKDAKVKIRRVKLSSDVLKVQRISFLHQAVDANEPVYTEERAFSLGELHLQSSLGMVNM